MNAPVRAADFQAALHSGIDIIPSGAQLGAEVRRVDLTQKLAPEAIAEIRAALVKHKVLFFHDQDISHEDHIRFGRYFGDLEGHPITQHVDGHPEILRIRNGEYAHLNDFTIPFIRAVNKWHADVTFRAAPSLGGVLRARLIPPRGGDTLFADMAAVFADLSAPMRERLEKLTATHDILKSYGWKLSPEEQARITAQFPPQEHPVVRVHPESGEKSLFVNAGFTTRINGIDEKESEELLSLIYDRVRVPEYQVRFKWTKHAVVFWDNRSTQHYPVADYWPHDREVERVTIVGDVPVGAG